MIWSDQEKSDITNLISVTPSDIKYISFGEILVSPYQSPLNYYRIIIMQNKKSGKEYIEIQPCYQILPKLKSKSQKSNIKKSVVVKPIKQNCAHKKINAENQLDILLNKIDLMIEELNDWIIYPHKIIKYRRKR